MLTEGGPKVIEYNARFGDPEAQAILPLLKSDLLEIMLACEEGRLNADDVVFSEGYSAGVVLASGGYPGDCEKGFPMEGLERAAGMRNTLLFHMGTRQGENGRVLTDGGRVLTVTGLGKTPGEALGNAYAGVGEIRFNGMNYRKDIGKTTFRQEISQN